jgi:hypothetical protein
VIERAFAVAAWDAVKSVFATFPVAIPVRMAGASHACMARVITCTRAENL